MCVGPKLNYHCQGRLLLKLWELRVTSIEVHRQGSKPRAQALIFAIKFLFTTLVSRNKKLAFWVRVCMALRKSTLLLISTDDRLAIVPCLDIYTVWATLDLLINPLRWDSSPRGTLSSSTWIEQCQLAVTMYIHRSIPLSIPCTAPFHTPCSLVIIDTPPEAACTSQIYNRGRREEAQTMENEHSEENSKMTKFLSMHDDGYCGARFCLRLQAEKWVN